MLIGYNTNGFAFHRLEDALEIIAELGYRCVALTLDVHHLDPFRATASEVSAVARQLDKLGLSCVIETGARYLLDPRRKHRPTLIDDDPGPRVRFLARAVEIAAELNTLAMSYWSGARPENFAGSDDVLFDRLARQVDVLEDLCGKAGIRPAFEPEPGMLIDNMSRYDRLSSLLGYRPGLTLDVGHLRCMEEEEEKVYLAKYADVLYNVHLDDMVRGDHRHLFFGEGEVDFPAVFKTLKELNYTGPACVELSEHSRTAAGTAAGAIRVMSEILERRG